jgi:hypothetical protein
MEDNQRHVSFESDSIVIQRGLENVSNFKIKRSKQFEEDWETVSKSKFDENDQKYVSLEKRLYYVHNDNRHTYACIDTSTRLRKMRWAITPGVSKSNGDRIFFCLFKNSRIIYLTNIAKSKEHHKDASDANAIVIGNKELIKYGLELKESAI